MASVERRQNARENICQTAEVRFGRDPAQHSIKVRNLSSRGLMGEGAVKVANGTRLDLELGDIGRVSGTVVWVQEPRFGVAFDDELATLS
ncbi:MAG: PilZ domain-containing protein [Erythrobacter sp.]